MTILIDLGLHGERIGSIFITGIFGNFYTKRGEFLTFKTGIPGGLASVSKAVVHTWHRAHVVKGRLEGPPDHTMPDAIQIGT